MSAKYLLPVFSWQIGLLSPIYSSSFLCIKTSLPYLCCELASASLRDDAILHNHDLIHGYTFEDFKVVSDDDNSSLWRRKFSEHFRNELKSIQVEARIDFVENDIGWLEELQLQYFEFTFFTTRKSYIQISFQEGFRNITAGEQRLHEPREEHRRKGIRSWCYSGKMEIVDSSEVFTHLDTLYLCDILKREENTLQWSLFWTHGKQVFIIQHDASFWYFIDRITHDDAGKRRFSRTIFSEDTGVFAFFYG